jgi:hypothetical protein
MQKGCFLFLYVERLFFTNLMNFLYVPYKILFMWYANIFCMCLIFVPNMTDLHFNINERF